MSAPWFGLMRVSACCARELFPHARLRRRHRARDRSCRGVVTQIRLGQLTILRSAAQGGTASPVHVHDSEDEIIVLLKGSGIWWIGDQRWQLSEGGVAFMPRNVPHAYRLTSPTVDMLTLCTPAGAEAFFRTAGWDLSRPRPDGWEITPAGMAAAAAATGQTIIGPPLAADQLIPSAYLTGRQAR